MKSVPLNEKIEMKNEAPKQKIPSKSKIEEIYSIDDKEENRSKINNKDKKEAINKLILFKKSLDNRPNLVIDKIEDNNNISDEEVLINKLSSLKSLHKKNNLFSKTFKKSNLSPSSIERNLFNDLTKEKNIDKNKAIYDDIVINNKISSIKRPSSFSRYQDSTVIDTSNFLLKLTKKDKDDENNNKKRSSKKFIETIFINKPNNNKSNNRENIYKKQQSLRAPSFSPINNEKKRKSVKEINNITPLAENKKNSIFNLIKINLNEKKKTTQNKEKSLEKIDNFTKAISSLDCERNKAQEDDNLIDSNKKEIEDDENNINSKLEGNSQSKDMDDSYPNEENFNLNDFTLEDYNNLKKEIENEKKILETEIKSVTSNKFNNIEMTFKGKFGEKWNRAKFHLKTASKMKKLNDDIKNFGSSFNFTGIQQKIVKLDNFFQRQKTLTQKISNKFIFVPESNFLNYWSIVISFLLIYASYITPYRIVYFDKTDVNDIWFFIETLVDLLFFIDILICMNTCYYNDKGILIYSRIKIFTHYLKSWMIIDIIGIFPFALIETITESGDSSVDSNDHEDFFIMFKLPKLYRLIRIIRLFKFMKRAKKPKFIQSIEDFLHLTTANTRIIKFFFTCSVLIHIFGCLWYFAAKVNSFGPHTWIYEMGLTNENDFTLYLYSIYWSIATLSTAGYGDVHAYNEIEVTISIIWLIFGAGFYSFTLGSLSNLLANSNSKRTILSNKLTLMDQFCKENKFNKDLRFRLKKALEYASLKSLFSSNEKNELLEEIPIELKFKISENMFRGIINKIQFFKKKDKSFIAHFVTLLKPLRINQGEFIYKKNEYPNLIYFLFKGRVDYIVGPQNITFKTLVEGCYFGEIEVYQKVGRYFSCRAETLCDLLTISGENFKHIVCSYPDFEKEIKNILKERKQRNLLALNNIQTIAQISKNSEFWNKKKEYNLYEVVKKKNRRNASLPSQKLWASKTLANEEKEGGKFKKFFTRLFTRRPTIHITKNDSQDSLVLPISDAALSSKKNESKADKTKIFSFAESEQKEQTEKKDKQNENLKNFSLIEEKKSITLLNYENNESTTIHNNLSDKKQIEENNKNYDENISGSIKKRVSIHSPKNIEQHNLDEIKNEKKKNENELIIPLKASLKSPSNRKYSSGTPVSPLKMEKIEEMKSILESEKVVIYSEKTSDKNKINEKDNINDINIFNAEKREDNISQSFINSPEKNIETQMDKLPLQEEKGKKRIKSRLLRNNEIGNIVEQYHEFERRKTRIISADKQNINLKTFKNRIKIFKIMSITNNEKIDLLENETIDINEKLVKINKSLQDALNNFKILKQNPENKKAQLKDNSVEKEENYDKNEK